jgi:hypothetical protein
VTGIVFEGVVVESGVVGTVFEGVVESGVVESGVVGTEGTIGVLAGDEGVDSTGFVTSGVVVDSGVVEGTTGIAPGEFDSVGIGFVVSGIVGLDVGATESAGFICAVGIVGTCAVPDGAICIVGIEIVGIEVSGLAIGDIAGLARLIAGEVADSVELGLAGFLIDWAIAGIVYPASTVATPMAAICFSLLTFISRIC